MVCLRGMINSGYRIIRDRLFPPNTKKRELYYAILLAVMSLHRLGLVKWSKDRLLRVLHSWESKPASTIEKKDRAGYWPGCFETAAGVIEIDVIIVTFNSGKKIVSCLEGLLSSTYPAKLLNLCIVDNASADSTVEVVKKEQGRLGNVRLLRSNRNLGFGTAVNLGVKSGTAPYILLLNPDAVVEAETISRLIKRARYADSLGYCAWEARQQPFEHPKSYDPITLDAEWVSAACCLFRRSAFEQVGGFDETIFLYGEDVDLSWRLRGHGYRLMYIPEARVNHYSYERKHEIKPAQFYHSIISNAILRIKHGSLGSMLDFLILFCERLVDPPALPYVRMRLIKILLAALPTFIKVSGQRLVGKTAAVARVSRFNGWDYEIQRKGAFFKVKDLQSKPLVSVIVRTKNRPYFLKGALQCLRNQTYRNVQVILIEDGPPHSAECLCEFSDLEVLYCPTISHVGRTRAGNLGLAVARGRYIGFLDDDDLLFADHFETLLGELENSTAKVAYSTAFEVRTRQISTNPFIVEEAEYYVKYGQHFDRELLKTYNYIPINCVLFHRDVYLNEGGFDETLDVLEDWDLWVRYSARHDFLFIDKTTCLYRVPLEEARSKERQKVHDLAEAALQKKWGFGKTVAQAD